MTRLGIAVLFAAGTLAACSSSKSPAKADSAIVKMDGSNAASVMSVSCTGITPAATVTTSGDAYSPMLTTISQGQVVQFVMIQSSNHNVTSSTPNLSDNFNTTDCLMFTQPGTYSFHCSVHGFMGSITVN